MKPSPLLLCVMLAAPAACRREEPPPASQTAEASPGMAAPAAMLPDGGYDRILPLFEEMRGEAKVHGVEVSLEDVRSAFRLGFVEMDYRFLFNLTVAETGLSPVPDIPGDPSERGGLKCRKDGWVYPSAHPGPEDGYEECCRRNAKRKTTATDMGDSTLLMTKGDGYADSWNCYRWQPRRRTWSAYGEEELIDGFEVYAERNFGAQRQAEDLQRAASVQGKERVLAAFHNRLKHEGAKYRVEQERLRLRS